MAVSLVRAACLPNDEYRNKKFGLSSCVRVRAVDTRQRIWHDCIDLLKLFKAIQLSNKFFGNEGNDKHNATQTTTTSSLLDDDNVEAAISNGHGDATLTTTPSNTTITT